MDWFLYDDGLCHERVNQQICKRNDFYVFFVLQLVITRLLEDDTLLEYLSVFSPNTGKYGPEITPYLDTFHAAIFTVLGN